MSEYIGEYVVSLTPKTFTDLRFHRHEEIVRCRDCKHCKRREGILPPIVCERCGYHNFKTEPDRFCAWGELEDVIDGRRY